MPKPGSVPAADQYAISVQTGYVRHAPAAESGLTKSFRRFGARSCLLVALDHAQRQAGDALRLHLRFYEFVYRGKIRGGV